VSLSSAMLCPLFCGWRGWQHCKVQLVHGFSADVSFADDGPFLKTYRVILINMILNHTVAFKDESNLEPPPHTLFKIIWTNQEVK
jgi:hypothetical protein